MKDRSLSGALAAAVTVRRLKQLLLLSFAVPAAMFVALAWHEHQRVASQARVALDQISQTILEHAIKTLETNELILDRSLDLLNGISDTTSLAEQAHFQSLLVGMTAPLSQIRNVMVWGTDGRPLLSTRYHPARRDLSVADRPFFQRHKAGDAKLSINEPVLGRWGGERVFNISKPRIDTLGRFAGVVSVSFSPEYFTDFFRRAVGDQAGFAIALLRAEGEVIARYPRVSSPLPDDSRFIATVREGRTYAFIPHMRGLDGAIRDVVFRKIERHPIYVAVSVTNAHMFSEWRQDLLVAALLLLPGSVLLAGVIWLALKRTESEHRAVLTAHEEELKRNQMEKQMQQLQRFEALGQLTSGLAHDFNNVLHIIATNAAAIRLLPPAVEKSRNFDAIERAVTTAKSLIVHLLSFAHKRKVALQRMSPAGLLPGMCELARHSLPKTITLECMPDPHVWDIAVDVSELELALINLTVNARDAMPAGGRITVRARNVSPGTEPVDGRLAAQDLVAISISDTGCGIPQDLLQRVFEPFFTTKGETNGSGLGLSRVYMFAAQMGGMATASNATDGGAVITLYIPRASDDDATDAFSGIEIRTTAVSGHRSPSADTGRLE